MPTVNVWTADLDVPAEEILRLEHHLDTHERARAQRFRFARDRRRFVVRRGLLKERLAQVLNEPPSRLAFSLGPLGKPALRDHRCRFSLSHSHERMALAISEVEVGCDIERIDHELDWAPISAQLFQPSTLNQLALLDPAEARTAFFRCWTRMEARVKAAGHGLGQSIDANTWPGEESDLAWRVVDVEVHPGYVLAVAAAKEATPCRVVIESGKALGSVPAVG